MRGEISPSKSVEVRREIWAIKRMCKSNVNWKGNVKTMSVYLLLLTLPTVNSSWSRFSFSLCTWYASMLEHKDIISYSFFWFLLFCLLTFEFRIFLILLREVEQKDYCILQESLDTYKRTNPKLHQYIQEIPGGAYFLGFHTHPLL